MSYQSLGLFLPLAAAAFAITEAAEPGHVDLDLACDGVVLGAQRVFLQITGGVSGAAQVDGPQLLAVVEGDDRALVLIGEVGQQLELDLGLVSGAGVCLPAPHPFVVGLEVGIGKGPLQACGVGCAAGDLEIDLDVDIGGAGVPERGVRTEQGWDEPAEQDEAGLAAVVLDDADQGEFRGGSQDRPLRLPVTASRQPHLLYTFPRVRRFMRPPSERGPHRRARAGGPASWGRRDRGARAVARSLPGPEGGGVRILVAGASGFVGRRLCRALDDAGHEVRAMTRRPASYDGAGTAVRGDVQDPAGLVDAFQGCQAAYYLVHSLDKSDFEALDAAAARAFGVAAAGLEQVVYLGGLGDDDDQLSAHLRSRREVERLLSAGGVPVTVLRAGIIVGHGGISWELTRQLVEHLPVMLTPHWVRTRAQPIAVDDVVRYLVGVLEVVEARGRVFEIGGPEVLAYVTMLRRVAAIEGRRQLVVAVPFLTPRLSARWLALVTDVDVQTGRSLIDSMANEVVVRDDSIRHVVPFEPMGFDEMVLVALGERARARRQMAGR